MNKNKYADKIISVTLYLGYAESGIQLRQSIRTHCKQNNIKLSAFVKQLILDKLSSKVV